MRAADEGCRVLLADGRALRARAVAYCVNCRAPLVPAWARPWLGAPLAERSPAVQRADPDVQSPAAPSAPPDGLASGAKPANGAGGLPRRSAAAPAQCGPTGGAQRADEAVAQPHGAAAGAAGSGEAGTLQLAGAVDVRTPDVAAAVAGRSVAVVGGGMTAAALALAAAALGAARVVLLARAALVVQEFECEVRRSGSPRRLDEHGTAAAPSVSVMRLPIVLHRSRPASSLSRFVLLSMQCCAWPHHSREGAHGLTARFCAPSFPPSVLLLHARWAGMAASGWLRTRARPTRARGCARRAARGRRRPSTCRARRRCRCPGACIPQCGSAEWLQELCRGYQVLFRTRPVLRPSVPFAAWHPRVHAQAAMIWGRATHRARCLKHRCATSGTVTYELQVSHTAPRL
jgi:hypothetical protein